MCGWTRNYNSNLCEVFDKNDCAVALGKIIVPVSKRPSVLVWEVFVIENMAFVRMRLEHM
jgi:hypothetical protein